MYKQIFPTINARDYKEPRLIMQNGTYRIRKLTPLECFRLMGVKDEDAQKMMATCSNTQCYKQAGNSIVVDVMCHLFQQLNIKQE